ncbi:hypothetical protein GOODEAATRI_015227 [Goodea atripinnis]|uniref:Uncharacterized protein n=1 Tax=Goodea atripinnis TaxID=208336 RepID=A0ABV0MJX6_9TELE
MLIHAILNQLLLYFKSLKADRACYRVRDKTMEQTLLANSALFSTWLLILLLSPNTSHPPTQAARKEWDCRLFPWIFCCKA